MSLEYSEKESLSDNSTSESQPTPQGTNAPKTRLSIDESSSGEIDFEELSEQFIEEFRQGKDPSVEEYAARYPEAAEDILDLFPTLLLLEKGGERENLTNYSQSVTSKGVVPQKVERLKNYLLRDEIGRGGMGVVYEAYDEMLKRVVALKVMKVFRGEEKQTNDRFKREARMAARLHHTNIVPVYGYDEVDGQFFYAMQLINGDSLEKIIRNRAQKALDNASERQPPEIRQALTLAESGVPNAENASQRSTPSIDAVRVGVADTVRRFVSHSDVTRDITPKFSASDVKKMADEGVSIRSRSPQNMEHPTRSATRDKSAKEPKKFKASSFAKAAMKPPKELLYAPFETPDYYALVCHIGIQAAEALDYAHTHGVVHRDIKPSNLIVDGDGDLWITDFGLAKEMDGGNDLTKQGQLVGTLRYLAPEALEGDFSAQSDVYSLGLTLYELLTLKPAFTETNYTKLFKLVDEGDIPRPRSVNKKTPKDLETIVLKALERSKNKRYASAADLADDLRLFLQERPIHARKVGFFGKVWRLCKRNRPAAFLSAVVILLGLSVVAFLTNANVQKQKLIEERERESELARIESKRAQNNLDLALTAFDHVFNSLGSDLDLKFNFIDDSSTTNSPKDGFAISDKDAKALEDLLDFYDQFARQNENEPTLLRKSAEAYVKIGVLRELLGHARYSDAFDKAYDFYTQSLESVESQEERAQSIVAKARIVLTIFENAPKGSDFDAVLGKCADSIEELSTLLNTPETFDVSDSLIAQLRFARATAKLHAIRQTDSLLGFFETPKYQGPDPKDIEFVQKDFDAARNRLANVVKTSVILSPEKLHMLSKFYTTYALWNASLGKMEEARTRLVQSASYAKIFMTNYPDDSQAYISTIMVDFVKAVVDSEIRSDESYRFDDYDAMREYETTKEDILQTVDKLLAKYPDAPFYAICRIVVCYHFAKYEAILGRLDKAEELLVRSDTQMQEFIAKNPNYDDFQFFGPLYAGYIELLVKENRFAEAEARFEVMNKALEELDAKIPPEKLTDAEIEKRRVRRAQGQERLRKIIDDAKEAAKPM